MIQISTISKTGKSDEMDVPLTVYNSPFAHELMITNEKYSSSVSFEKTRKGGTE